MKKSIAMFLCLVLMAGIVYAQEKQPKAPPPPPPPPKVEVVKFVPTVAANDEETREFYKRNPAVDAIRWKSAHQVILTFKNKEKKAETYNLSDSDEKEAFHEKYGDAPMPPPPPPKPKKNQQ